MPELPEVETVRRGLVDVMAGRVIAELTVTGRRTVRRHDPQKLIDAAVGQRVGGLRRLGKFLMLDLENNETVVMHLRMSGQFRWHANANDPVVSHTHAVFHMDNGGEVRFVDPRTFGELWVTTPDAPELWHMGRDAFEDLPTAAELAMSANNRRISVKAFLLDQRVIAGVGNIYADESLFRAKLRPDRSVATLTKQEWQSLRNSVRAIIDEAVDRRGSTLGDRQYVDLMGDPGSAQLMHKVYAKEGQRCPRCASSFGAVIERLQVAGRSSHFCPNCQV